MIETAERILRDLGFSVRRNEPYAGAFTTAHYGQPGKRVHALQIEVNRRLYMNEATVARSRDLPQLKKKMNRSSPPWQRKASPSSRRSDRRGVC